MNTSHPNILPLIAVDIKPKTSDFSMILEMMTNGTILQYITVKRTNRLRLVRPLVADVLLGWNH